MHVPLEVSQLCYYFLVHGGIIIGVVGDTRPRRSPIPSDGIRLSLKLGDDGGQQDEYSDKGPLVLRHYDFDAEDQEQEGEKIIRTIAMRSEIKYCKLYALQSFN